MYINSKISASSSVEAERAKGTKSECGKSQGTEQGVGGGRILKAADPSEVRNRCCEEDSRTSRVSDQVNDGGTDQDR